MPEKIYYRYNLYKKNGIDMHLVIDTIFEPKCSARIAQYAQNQYWKDNPDSTPPKESGIQVLTKSGLDEILGKNDNIEVYVSSEKSWYVYSEKKGIWMPDNARNFTYTASFYIQYSNDHDEVAIRSYFRPNLPSWKTVQEAKDELKNLDLEYVDFVADNGYTFFFVDKTDSSLFNPRRINRCCFQTIHSEEAVPYQMTISNTNIIPCEAPAVAYAVTCMPPAKKGNITSLPMKDQDYIDQARQVIVEGVTPNSGNSRLMYLMNAWTALDIDTTNYLPISEAVTSDGYAKIKTE